MLAIEEWRAEQLCRRGSSAWSGGHDSFCAGSKMAAPGYTAAIPRSRERKQKCRSLPRSRRKPLLLLRGGCSCAVRQEAPQETRILLEQWRATQAIGISQEQLRKSRRQFRRNRNSWANWWNRAAVELDGAELRLYFSPEKRPFADAGSASRWKRSVPFRARCSAGQCASVLNWKQWQGGRDGRQLGAPGAQELRAKFERRSPGAVHADSASEEKSPK